MSLFKLLIFFHYFSWGKDDLYVSDAQKCLFRLVFAKYLWKNLDFSGFICSLFSGSWQITYITYIFYLDLIIWVSMWNPSCCLTAAVQISCTLDFLSSGYTAPEALWSWWDWQHTSEKNPRAASENSNVFFFPVSIQCFFRNVRVRCLHTSLTQIETQRTCTVFVERTQ